MSDLAPEIAAFVRVVERGSFAAVAADTGYTSSGVSRMVSRLETTLGTRLLFRSTRQLSLTPEGEAFLPRAKSILEAIEVAGAELSAVATTPRGHVRLNCGTAFANHKLAPLLAKFARSYPEISLDISVTDHVSIRLPIRRTSQSALAIWPTARLLESRWAPSHVSSRQALPIWPHMENRRRRKTLSGMNAFCCTVSLGKRSGRFERMANLFQSRYVDS